MSHVTWTPFACLQESIKMLRSTIEAKSEVYGDLSPEVADTWKLIGSIHLSQGDTEKGLRCLKKVTFSYKSCTLSVSVLSRILAV